MFPGFDSPTLKSVRVSERESKNSSLELRESVLCMCVSDPLACPDGAVFIGVAPGQTSDPFRESLRLGSRYRSEERRVGKECRL